MKALLILDNSPGNPRNLYYVIFENIKFIKVYLTATEHHPYIVAHALASDLQF